MALIKWKAAVNGDWSTAADWSTGTVPTIADDAAINLVGNYTVTVTSAQSATSLDFNAAGAALVESATGKLTLGSLKVENGTVELNAANNISGAVLTGGLLSLGNAAALGGGDLALSGGELLATVNQGVALLFDFTNPGGSQSAVIAAAHGKILALNGQGGIFGPGVSLTFGTPSADGLVIWRTPSNVIGAPSAVTVAGGRLTAGDSGFSGLFPQTGPVTVAAGATIDLAGFATTISNLRGSGRVSSSGGATTLTLDGGAQFSGSITGALSLEVTGGSDIMLTGANTFTGSTTIGAGGTLNLGGQDGLAGSLRATSPIINNGELQIGRGNDWTLANPISGGGLLTQLGQGKTTINRANTYTGGTLLVRGTLAVGNAGALGSGAVTGVGGTLLGTITETLTNQLITSAVGQSSPQVTLAAATGTVFTLQSSLGWNLDPAMALNFGATGRAGTVVWSTPAGSTGTAAAVNVKFGTLKAGDANFSALFDDANSPVTVEAGARIDLAGFATTIGTLQGQGTVTTSSLSATTLTLLGGAFGGTISGGIDLDVEGDVTLTGAGTYIGTTTIGSGNTLMLGNGGTTGSLGIDTAIDNSGVLAINRRNALTLNNGMTGNGVLRQMGTGTTTINVGNTYTGGTSITNGTLAIGNANALGTGAVTIGGGILQGNTDVTLPNFLLMSGSFTIAAAHATTFTMGNGWQLFPGDGDKVKIGAPGRDGTVLWSAGGAPSGISGGATDLVEVVAGTLKAGDKTLDALLQGVAGTQVDAGATLDVAGFATTINGGLSGAGTVTNSGPLTTLTLPDIASFGGTLSGALTLNYGGGANLGGLSQYTGNTIVGGGKKVTNAATATFNLITDSGISGSGAGAGFVNNGLFEKTGGTGTSVVSVAFTNNGQVVIKSGHISFTGGLTNVGVIQGLLSGNTIAANAPGQATFFGGIGDNLIEVASAPIYVDGGGGIDTLKIASNMTLAPNSVVGVEAIAVADGVTANLANLTGPYVITLLSTAGGHAYVVGSQGNDTITGGAGNDRLNGGQGGDALSGGAGNDVYFVDNAGDEVTEAANGGIDRVISTIGYTLGGNVENLTLAGTADINGGGNVLANIIVGNGGDNILIGRGGGDTLSGNGGSDRFRYLAISDSGPGAGAFDHITDFIAGSGTGADKIDLSPIDGITSIQGLITPANPSQTPPATGLHAHSIAWYQAGGDTVVIANASATANHVDMEIVLEGVSASGLSTVAGVNFLVGPSLLAQSIAGSADGSMLAAAASSQSSEAGNQPWLAGAQHI